MPSWKEMTSKPREVREEVKEEVEVEKKPDDLESAIEETLKKYGDKSGAETEVKVESDDERRRTAIEMLKSGEDIEKVRKFLSNLDETIPSSRRVTSDPGSPMNPGRKIGKYEKFDDFEKLFPASESEED